ncbi:hypothetical protein [Staphylococcus caeli]|uniref:hypothetical protein n=1 Tax=Staphylococcus caeli TaxID=2201815 RepID=UPI003F560F18
MKKQKRTWKLYEKIFFAISVISIILLFMIVVDLIPSTTLFQAIVQTVLPFSTVVWIIREHKVVGILFIIAGVLNLISCIQLL